MKFFKKHIFGYSLLMAAVLQPMINYGMRRQPMRQHYNESAETALNEKLEVAVFYGRINEVKTLIESGADSNGRLESVHLTVMSTALERASYSLDQGDPDGEIRLKIIELLIQNGAKINEPVCFDYTALEKEILNNRPTLPIIKLLLNYGAEITDEALAEASNKPNSKEINRLLALHQKLGIEALFKPTGELLTLAIVNDMPYIVQLIIDAKPKLITLFDIKLARVHIPAFVSILTKAFNMAKFRELAKRKEFPIEIAQHIEKFALSNK